VATTTALWGCPEERQVANSCVEDSACASGFCHDGGCLDPQGDADGDGIANAVERFFGSNLLVVDSDGDGRSDTDEYGSALSLQSQPLDSDDDGMIDAIESSVEDGDGDCLADQADPRNDTFDPPTEAQVNTVCGQALVGVCEGSFAEVRFQCERVGDALVWASEPCNYAAIEARLDEEICGNNLDDTCDGQTDEDCPSCLGPLDCADGDDCTADLCEAGECSNPPIPGCGVDCVVDGDCDDSDACTEDRCNADTCTNTAIQGCGVECVVDSDCADGDPCTSDLCDAEGSCTNPPAPGTVDTDGDGVCDSQDPDIDNDGIENIDDCAPLDGTVYPGAPVICGDGLINDCTPTSPGLAGDWFVDFAVASSGDGSASSPFKTIEEALGAAASNGGTTIHVATSDYDAPFVVDETTAPGITQPILIHGGFDANCDWEATAGTTQVTATASPIVTLAMNNTDVTLRQLTLELELELAAPDPLQIVGLDASGAGTHILQQSELFTPSLTAQGSTNTGFRASEGLVRCEECTVDVGLSDLSVALENEGGGIEVFRGQVSVAAGVAGEANGLDSGGPTRIHDSTLTVSGDDGTASGVLVSAATLWLTNTFVTLMGTSTAKAINGTSSSTFASGNVVAVPGAAGDVGFAFSNAIVAGSHRLANNVIDAGNSGTAVVFAAGGAGELDLGGNGIEAGTLLDVDGATTDSFDVVNGSQYPQATGNSGSNVASTCGLSPTSTSLSAASPCASLGVDPTTLGFSEPEHFMDRNGAARPGADTMYAIGPFEVDAAQACADGDSDGVCDILDRCPGGVDGAGLSDQDGDGCWGVDEDCVDTDPTIYVGAPELCDGKDNDCSRGGVTLVPAGAIFVQTGAGGNAGTSDSPFETLAEALSAANDGQPHTIVVGSGTYLEQVAITEVPFGNLSQLHLQGSADPACAWEPVEGLLTPGTVVEAASPVLLVDQPSLDLTVSDMAFADLTVDGSSYTAVRLATTDVGPRTFVRSLVETESAGGAGLSIGFDVLSANVTLDLVDTRVKTGSASNSTGVKMAAGARLTADGVYVTAAGTGGGTATGFELGSVGTGAAGADMVVNSTVVTSGNLSGTAKGVRKLTDGDLWVANSVFRIPGDETSTAGVEVNGEGSLHATGLYVDLWHGGTPLSLTVSGASSQSIIANSIISNADFGDGVVLSAANGAVLTMENNAFDVVGAALAAPQGAATAADVNACSWTGCLAAASNQDLSCPMQGSTGAFTLPPTSMCVGGGTDPQGLGLAIPGQELDSAGDPRPGADGQWDIGPDEVQ